MYLLKQEDQLTEDQLPGGAAATPVAHLSYSGLSTYRTCSEQFRLEKVEGLGGGAPGWYNCGGSAVHAMTEAEDWTCYTGEAHGKTFNDFFDEELELAEEESGLHRSEFKAAGRKTKAAPHGEGEAWWRFNGPSMVASWNRWLANFPGTIWVTPEGVQAIELEYTFMIGDVPNKGVIDRILELADGTLLVVDLKTGKPPKDTLQLGTYAAYCQSQGWPVNRGGYWMARDGILTGMHDLATVTGARLDYEYDQAWRGIHAGIFPASPSGLCNGWCPVAKFCYAGGHLSDPSHIPFSVEASSQTS